MRKLLIPLLAAIAFPTVVNAEEIKMIKIQYFDDLSYAYFFGSMVAICHADTLGYLKNSEKVEMISYFTDYHKNNHRTKSTLNNTQKKVILNVKDLFQNCLP
tara:strand:- start:237 stop:542 length:306 start_codon:yes stop_codon:yes gene_type:complete